MTLPIPESLTKPNTRLSDHHPITARFSYARPSTPYLKPKLRVDPKSVNAQQFQKALAQQDWTVVYSTRSTTNPAHQCFLENVQAALISCKPRIRKLCLKSKNWWTKELTALKKLRNHASRQWERFRSDETRDRYWTPKCFQKSCLESEIGL